MGFQSARNPNPTPAPAKPPPDKARTVTKQGGVSTMPVGPTYQTSGPSSTPGYGGAPMQGGHGEGSTGYVKPLAWSNPTNPYSAQGAADQGAVQSGMEDAQGKIASLQGKLSGNDYPAFPNSYGLGAPIPGSPSGPGYMGQPTTQVSSEAGSNGFNPWSLMGEATARGN